LKNLSLYTILILLLLVNNLQGQIVNGNGFLQQNRVEVGVANNGSYGTTESAPAGYHPRCWPLTPTMYNPATGVFAARLDALGFVADYDTNGWGGSWPIPTPPSTFPPPYIGDYFMPGTPQEGWVIEVNGQRCNAFCGNYTLNGASGYTGGTMNGVSHYVSNVGGLSRSFWEGNYGFLNIKQVTTLRKEMLYFTGDIKLHNTGPDTMKNVYYMRTLDPDNDVSKTLNFDTKNKNEYQIPNPGNKVLMSCISTVNSYAYLGLGTIDCRAKSFIRLNGLVPPPDSLAYLFSGTHPAMQYTDSLTADVGVGIIYQIGTIAPGDSADLHFAYVLKESMLDAALDEIKPQVSQNGSTYGNQDTLYACQGSNVPLHIVNGSQYHWTWSASAPLSNNTGVNTTVTLGTLPVTVTAFGVGICADTLTFLIIPSNSIYTNVSGHLCNGSFVHHGVTYTSAGTFLDTLISSGCDSIFEVHIFNGAPTSSVLNQDACIANGYFFNGSTQYVSGTYHDTLVNSVGCDSLITLHLNIHPHLTTTITDTFCQYPQINGVTYTQSGTYTQALTDMYGCDSTLILHLTINPILASISQTGSQLTAIPTGVTYQWLKCSPYQVLPGATSSVYNTGSNGGYAVVSTINGCSDTSVCVQVTGVGVDEQNLDESVILYPNPVSDMVQLNSPVGFQNAVIRLFAADGRLLRTCPPVTVNDIKISMQNYADGFYVIEISQDNALIRKKLCKISKK
jgi:hypothetical protein